MEFHNTHISSLSIKLVKEVLESTWVSEGKMVKSFEGKLSEQLGVVNPVATNSCTSALHLALVVAGIKPEDEVILSAQTFIASGLAIKMQGAKTVFADIEYETGNISPKSIREKITEKTKAIMVVHWSGYPCDMEEINNIAQEHKLVVIEDAAHALGAKYKGKAIGAVSRFTAFSFQAIKHLTTGDGGALCCIDKDDYELARELRWFGISRENSSPSILGERQYDIKEIGYKYHLNDVGAAIGIGNLSDFPVRLRKMQEIGKTYREELKNVSGLQLLELKNDREHAYWLFTMLVENRLNFITKLKECNIPTSVVHQRIDRNSVFGGITEGLINQEKFDEKQIAIPIHDGLTQEDVNHIIKTIKSGW
ncbi:MAG: DegT/DnrJ/EryC1/StrS family aminotransferase [bacterium]|nr:DegT/DnrJ/EryC1/StrS family aminotransferase [bacterium]